jgi:beta-glucosidase
MQGPFLKFPAGFLWGTSTSAHQAEGDNCNDWTEWEQENKVRLAKEAEKQFKDSVPDWQSIAAQAQNPENYVSGGAAGHYRLFCEDLGLARALGLNAYRFSEEWARVEPQPGQYDRAAIEHYQEVIRCARQNGLEPLTTLWHRTNPVWVKSLGGWEDPRTVDRFLLYAEKMAKSLGRQARLWTVVNEPMLYIGAGYISGEYPPGFHNSYWRAEKAFRGFVRAFKQAARIIRRINPEARVGTSDAAILLKGCPDKWHNNALAKILDYFLNARFTGAVLQEADFLGVQYYKPEILSLELRGWRPAVRRQAEWPQRTDMGWGIYPQGLYEFVKAAAKFHKPIYITENGLADARDATREEFIKEHLRCLHQAIREGAGVRGYFYWSLLDNLEWDKGFWPKFGLVEVDRQTFARTVRPSARVYGQIAKNNGF